jgi:hypothetical protein
MVIATLMCGTSGLLLNRALPWPRPPWVCLSGAEFFEAEFFGGNTRLILRFRGTAIYAQRRFPQPFG